MSGCCDPGSPTMSVGHLRGRRCSRASSDASEARLASYGDNFFGVIRRSRGDSLLPIELDGLLQRRFQSLKQFPSRPLLAVHLRHFLDPPGPPIPVPFGHSGARVRIRSPPQLLGARMTSRSANRSVDRSAWAVNGSPSPGLGRVPGGMRILAESGFCYLFRIFGINWDGRGARKPAAPLGCLSLLLRPAGLSLGREELPNCP